MSHNKSAKEALIKKYGEQCFIDRLKINTEPRTYKSSKQYKKMKKLTYHHIVEKQNGGEATIENGALLSVENHEWFHRQDAITQQILNSLFQELKEVELIDNLELPFELKAKVIQFNEKGKVIEQEREKEERYE